MMLSYFDRFSGFPDLFESLVFDDEFLAKPLDFNESKELSALQKASEWLIIMQEVIVHCNITSARKTGLFGLLGDAWIQIVEVSNEDRLQDFFTFMESCDDDQVFPALQDLRRQSTDSMQRRLNRAVLRQYRSTELAEKIRPAIKFRLCTRKCNEALRNVDCTASVATAERLRHRQHPRHAHWRRCNCQSRKGR